MLKAQYILQKAAATHIEALGMGFFSVVSAEAVFPAMLTAPELRLLLCGVPRVDLRELKPLTECAGPPARLTRPVRRVCQPMGCATAPCHLIKRRVIDCTRD